jgi:putative glutamine amidotransferase
VVEAGTGGAGGGTGVSPLPVAAAAADELAHGGTVAAVPVSPLPVALTAPIDPHAGSYARPAVFLYTSYIHALEQYGLAPVLITAAHSPASIAVLVAGCAGLVLSGGEDVHPSRYGAAPDPALRRVDVQRDAIEFAAVECAIGRRMPIFGICRGLQLLNVHFGGTLHQDIAADRAGAGECHEQAGSWYDLAHEATVAPGSRLRSIVGVDRLRINSFHHQAVRRIGSGLRVVARADDGIIEAIEHGSYPWLLGVQWHPERSEAGTPAHDHDRRIFAAFRQAVSDFAAGR